MKSEKVRTRHMYSVISKREYNYAEMRSTHTQNIHSVDSFSVNVDGFMVVGFMTNFSVENELQSG